MKKFLIGLLAGVSAGILFAPKSGKKLREQLKGSDECFMDFGNALLDAAKDAGSEVQDFVQTKEMQKILTSGKKGVEDFLSVLEEKTNDMSKKAQMELGTLVESAIETAQKTKKSAVKKAASVKSQVSQKADQAKKSVVKKATAIKKTAQKAIQKTTTPVKKTQKKK